MGWREHIYAVKKSSNTYETICRRATLEAWAVNRVYSPWPRLEDPIRLAAHQAWQARYICLQFKRSEIIASGIFDGAQRNKTG